MAGLYYEQLEIGLTFDHDIRRTVTEMDNVLFSSLTHNPAALHLDEEYCRTQSQFGTRIVNSAFTLGLVVGISVGDTTLGTTVANLGWDEVRFPAPVFHGDTIHVRSTVVDRRESRSNGDRGIVVFLHEGFNQKDQLIASCKRSAMMRKQPA